jgi:hypothetical protein
MTAEAPEVTIFLPSATLTQRAKITYRQLDHWVTQGYLVPETGSNPGQGRDRQFSEVEAQVAAWMADLVRAGFSPKRAESLARHLLHTGPVLLDGGFVLSRPVSTEVNYDPDGTVTELRLVHRGD